MSFEDMLDKTMTVQSVVPVANGMGGSAAPTVAAVASDVPCAIKRLSQQERSVHGQIAATSTHVVYASIDSFAVTSQHRLVIGGKTYYVTGEPYRPREHHQQIYVSDVETVHG